MSKLRSQRAALWGSIVLYLSYKNPLGAYSAIRVFGVYYAVSLYWIAVAYAGSLPTLLGKRKDGTIAMWAYVFVGPWLWQTWVQVALAHTVSKYRGIPKISTVGNGLYLGCAPTEAELARRSIACVVDATADLPRLVHVKSENYLCIPILDGDAPSVEQLEMGADFVCRHLRDNKAVLVHCGYGIGRSTTVMCAVLVKLRMFETWPEAFEHIRKIRPTVRLNEAYVGALQLWTLIRSR